MKSQSMPIKTIVLIILILIVLAAVVILFMGLMHGSISQQTQSSMSIASSLTDKATQS